MKNTCQYLIVCCMDFRIQTFVRRWAQTHLSGEKYDYIGFAGATKELDIILTQVDLAVRLHGVQNVILIHHEDCGAYGPEGTFQVHQADLRRARERILERHSDLVVEAYFLQLSGAFIPVD